MTRLHSTAWALALAVAAVTPLAACSPGPAANVVNPALNAAGSLTGDLVNVVDGDTLRVRLAGGQVVRVRVGGIDAPEHGQPFADLSRDHLQSLAQSGPIRIDAYKTDPYGRYVATVFAGNTDVGLAQVADGMAWHFKRYAREQSSAQRDAYAGAELRARRRGLGLWAGERPQEPWEFRRQAAVRTD